MFHKIIWKVTVTGKKGSGKSSLISSAAYNCSSPIDLKGFTRKRINMNFNSEEYDIDLLFLEMPIELLNDKVLSKSTFVLLTADITDMGSLKIAEEFIKKYNGDMEIFLIGMKSDLRYISQFWENDMDEIGNRYNIKYYIYNNKLVFTDIMDEILKSVLTKIYNQNK